MAREVCKWDFLKSIKKKQNKKSRQVGLQGWILVDVSPDRGANHKSQTQVRYPPDVPCTWSNRDLPKQPWTLPWSNMVWSLFPACIHVPTYSPGPQSSRTSRNPSARGPDTALGTKEPLLPFLLPVLLLRTLLGKKNIKFLKPPASVIQRARRAHRKLEATQSQGTYTQPHQEGCYQGRHPKTSLKRAEVSVMKLCLVFPPWNNLVGSGM